MVNHRAWQDPVAIQPLSPIGTNAEVKSVVRQGLQQLDILSRMFNALNTMVEGLVDDAPPDPTSADYVLGVNFSGSDWEYKDIVGTANQVAIAHAVGSITVSTPQDIDAAANVQFGSIHASGGVSGQTAVSYSDRGIFEDDISNGISILAPDDAYGNITWGCPTAADSAGISYAGPSAATAVNRDSMIFYMGTTPYLWLKDDGKLGVGKHTPVQTVDIDGTLGCGTITSTGNLIIADAGTVGSTTATGAITIQADGSVGLSGTLGCGTITSTGNLVIADAGTIGSASDVDAISIAADGSVTLTVQEIADNHVLTVDDADAADNDYAKFTANGLEGRSYAQVRDDLSLDTDDNVEFAHISWGTGGTAYATLSASATTAKLISGAGIDLVLANSTGDYLWMSGTWGNTYWKSATGGTWAGILTSVGADAYILGNTGSNLIIGGGGLATLTCVGANASFSGNTSITGDIILGGAVTAGAWEATQIEPEYLSGGTASPGNKTYYGTDENGTLGFWPMATGLPDGLPSIVNGSPAVLSTDAAGNMVWKYLAFYTHGRRVTAWWYPGQIFLNLPQDISASSQVQFGSIGAGTSPDPYHYLTVNGDIRMT